MISLKKASESFLVLIAIALAVIAVGRIINGTLGAFSPTGAWDFEPYWNHGGFLRPGTHWAYPSEGGLPAVLSPPLLFVFSLFSYFPWPVARTMWMTVVVTLVLAMPLLLFRLLPIKISLTHRFLIALSFYAFTGTSIAIRAGQPTVLVLFLILLAMLLIRRNGRVLPGIILGLALSKLSLSFPLLLFLLYKRHWSVVVIGIGVQILGFVGLSLLVQSPLHQVISNYRSLVDTLAGSSYINLIHLAGHFEHTPTEFVGIGAALSLLVFGAVWWGIVRHDVKTPSPELWDYTLFAFLNVWGLLVAFHQQYDIGASMFVVALLIGAINYPNLWGLSPFQGKLLTVLTLVGLIAIISLPGLSYVPFIHPIWAPIRWKLMTIGIGVLTLTCIWLWRQGLRHSPSAS